jgi:hypothetical protein
MKIFMDGKLGYLQKNTCTANEGPVRILNKYLVPIYGYPEMKLQGLVISRTEL